MPDNASTKAADYATTHGFKILRVGAGMRAQAFATLQELDKELASIVAAAGTQPTLNSAKYAAMQNDAKATIADAYNIISKNHGKALDELAGIEWQASNKMINNAIGVDLVSGNIPRSSWRPSRRLPSSLGIPARIGGTANRQTFAKSFKQKWQRARCLERRHRSS